LFSCNREEAVQKGFADGLRCWWDGTTCKEASTCADVGEEDPCKERQDSCWWDSSESKCKDKTCCIHWSKKEWSAKFGHCEAKAAQEVVLYKEICHHDVVQAVCAVEYEQKFIAEVLELQKTGESTAEAQQEIHKRLSQEMKGDCSDRLKNWFYEPSKPYFRGMGDFCASLKKARDGDEAKALEVMDTLCNEAINEGREDCYNDAKDERAKNCDFPH